MFEEGIQARSQLAIQQGSEHRPLIGRRWILPEEALPSQEHGRRT
jgi:hypothetical protein